MKGLKKYIFLFTLLFPLCATSQILSGLRIGQSSTNSYTKAEPAKFIATYPEVTNADVKNSYLLNGFIGLDLFESRRFTFSVIAEWQRNTLIEKEQDVKQFGVNTQYIFRINEDIQTYTADWDIYTSFDFKSNNDRIKDEKGIVSSLSFSNDFPRVWKKLNIFQPNKFHPNGDTSPSKLAYYFQLKHTHSLGLDYLSSSSLMMSNLTFNIEIYPFSGLLKSIPWIDKYNILQVKWAVIQRGKISGDDSLVEIGALIQFGIAFNYQFDKDGTQAISIGYDVSDGPNPLKGLEDQKFGQLSVKLKLKL